MVLGFNHNIQYKGEIFHIQTEDSGVETPHIITLLYRGGTIISSKKTSYADIIRMDNLEQGGRRAHEGPAQGDAAPAQGG